MQVSAVPGPSQKKTHSKKRKRPIVMDQPSIAESMKSTETAPTPSQSYKPPNPEQQAFLDAVDEEKMKRMIVVAGPGSGKTNTISTAVVNIARKHPDARILIVMFNVAAEDTMVKRIESNFGLRVAYAGERDKGKKERKIIKIKVKVQKEDGSETEEESEAEVEVDVDIWNPWDPPKGISCMTFNKFAFKVCAQGRERGDQVELNKQIPTAADILQEKPLVHRVQGVEVPIFDNAFFDESQDVTGKFVDFVESQVAGSKRHCIIGDNKQKLLTGAVWFMDLVRAAQTSDPTTVFNFPRNHRSAISVVTLTNAFGQRFFPTLHQAQIPMSEKQGKVAIVRGTKDELGTFATRKLMEHQPQDIYLIAPISIDKFRMSQITMDIKNKLKMAKSPYELIVLAGHEKGRPYLANEPIYYAGTSKKLKGTEKKVVLLLGCAAPYGDYGILDEDVIMNEFVCLSRAIEELYILVCSQDKIEMDSPLSFLMHYLKYDMSKVKEVKRANKKRDLLKSVAVKDDLSHTTLIDVEDSWLTRVEVPGLRLDLGSSSSLKHNEDFAGYFVETLLALHLNPVVTYPWQSILYHPETHIKAMGPDDEYCCDIDRETGNIMLKLRPTIHYDDEGKAVVPKATVAPPKHLVQYIRGDDILEKAYALAVLKYTSELGTWWMASEGFLDAIKPRREHIMEFLDNFTGHLFGTGVSETMDDSDEATDAKSTCDQTLVSWNQSIRRTIMCIRPPGLKLRGQFTDVQLEALLTHCGYIKGVTDLQFQHIPVELKYTMEDIADVRQAAIYSDILQKTGLLVNVKAGAVYKIKPANRNQVDMYTRTYLACKNGISFKPGKNKRLKIPHMVGAVFIVADVNLDFDSAAQAWTRSGLTKTKARTGHFMEVGAVAFYAGTSDIEATFWQIADGCVETTTGGYKYRSGLARTTDYDGTTLKQKTKEWFKSVPGRKILLTWSLEEAQAVQEAGIEVKRTVSVKNLFTEWLTLNGHDPTTVRTLRDAVNKIYGSGQVVFEPFRAFEHVVALTAVANAVLDYSTVL